MKKAMIIGLLLFGMNVQANDKVYELKKKAIYFEIKAQLAAEAITGADSTVVSPVSSSCVPFEELSPL